MDMNNQDIELGPEDMKISVLKGMLEKFSTADLESVMMVFDEQEFESIETDLDSSIVIMNHVTLEKYDLEELDKSQVESILNSCLHQLGIQSMDQIFEFLINGQQEQTSGVYSVPKINGLKDHNRSVAYFYISGIEIGWDEDQMCDKYVFCCVATMRYKFV